MKAPPFLFNFYDIDHYLRALPAEIQTPYKPHITKLISNRLPPVVSIRCLSTLVGYSAKFVGALYHNTEHYYRTFRIPKGKSRRTIHAPRVALKVIQKWFGQYLDEALTFSECVYGFVKGRSAVQAAAVHCRSKWLYSVDITDFFSSTPMQKIIEALVSIGYSKPGAEIISKLCCYNRFLSQGSPASPVLSNLVFRKVDTELLDIAKRHEVLYTRYADDIVFSGKSFFPENLKQEVIKVVETHGWQLSADKEHYAEIPNRLKVYGLLVNNERPRLTKGYRNKIRAFKHLMKENKVAEENFARIRGHLAYAKSVEEFE